MHRPILLLGLPLLALVGCKEEPDFDERYTAQEAQLRTSANQMQQDLSRRIATSREAAEAMAQAQEGNASLLNVQTEDRGDEQR